MILQKGPAKPGSIQALDPFNRKPAGWTLTQPPGKWPWDNPPKYADPGEAVSFILDRLENPDVEEQFIRLMFAGISIQEIVQTVAIGGFSQGYYSPDVAELIKAPIAFYFLGLAAEYQIPVKFFATPDGLPARDRGIDENALFSIMKDRNPEFAKFIMENLNSTQEVSEEAKAEGFIGMSQELLGVEEYEGTPEGIEEEEE